MNELKHSLAALIPHLDWRVHGLGVLQAYITEGDEELRLHIWHPDLCTTQDTGRPHNHRFDLKSHVLVGTMIHEEWHLSEDPDGEWYKWSVVHARAQSKSSKDMERLSDVSYYVFKSQDTILPGQTYTFQKGRFHRSIVNGLCVTLVTKTNQSGSATILGYKENIKHSFINTVPIEKCGKYFDMAIEALRA